MRKVGTERAHFSLWRVNSVHCEFPSEAENRPLRSRKLLTECKACRNRMIPMRIGGEGSAITVQHSRPSPERPHLECVPDDLPLTAVIVTHSSRESVAADRWMTNALEFSHSRTKALFCVPEEARMDADLNGVDDRVALFISHANPEDNSFAIWLGAKLSALGYEVWADVLRLRGGDDWQRKLERALRHRTRKLLLVANPVSVEKQGVRNEVQIATTVGQTIKDAEFIIPLRLKPFDAPFLIAHAQYIDFQGGWARGLAELLVTLEESYRIPRRSGDASGIWREVQLIDAKAIVERPERLVSNWLFIARLPRVISLYDFSPGTSLGDPSARFENAPWPIVPYRHGFLSLAPLSDLQGHFGPYLRLAVVGQRRLDTFLDSGWRKHGIERWDARNKFSDLARQAIERHLRERGLRDYALSNRRSAW